MRIANLFRKSDFGLVVDWDRYRKKSFYSAMTPFLIRAIIKAFNPVIITNQKEYNNNKRRLKKILSLELGVPTIKYDNNLQCVKALFHSDPHYETDIRNRYFFDNNFDYVLSFYKNPFFYHFPKFPSEKFVHFPWAIPDELIITRNLSVKSEKVVIFGGRVSDAYDIRNWCRNQAGVENFDLSGVENKLLSDYNYYKWLSNFDAIIAAGSSNPKYDLVTPKYFEIPASGSLLFAHYCKDLEVLGFNDENCIIFSRENFTDKLNNYKKDPNKYLNIRENGRDFIMKYHKISDRIKLLKRLFYD